MADGRDGLATDANVVTTFLYGPGSQIIVAERHHLDLLPTAWSQPFLTRLIRFDLYADRSGNGLRQLLFDIPHIARYGHEGLDRIPGTQGYDWLPVDHGVETMARA